MGSVARPSGAAVSAIAAACQDLLDHLSEGDREPAEDRDLPRLVIGGSRQRPASTSEEGPGVQVGFPGAMNSTHALVTGRFPPARWLAVACETRSAVISPAGKCRLPFRR